MKYDYGLKPLKFWCQKVLPLVYDESLSYEELLCKVVAYLNEVIEGFNGIPEYIQSLVSDEKLKEILAELLDELREQIARINEGENTNASADRTKGELIWLNGKLAIMTRNILAGDRYVEDTGEQGVTGNFEYTSVEIEINKLKEDIEDKIGNLDNLDTTDKNNLVSAINEVLTTLSTVTGDLDNLDTTAKNNLVSAINEVLTTLGNTTGDLDNLDTTNKNNLVSAINEVLTTLGNVTGDLDNLDTTDKNNLVSAINEVLSDIPELGWVTPEDYGAKGDGITDDSSAINAAIASGKPVRFINNYAIANTIVINLNGSRAIDAQGHSLTALAGMTGYMVEIHTMYGYLKNIILNGNLLTTLTGCVLMYSDENNQSQFYLIDNIYTLNAVIGISYGNGYRNAQSENTIHAWRTRSIIRALDIVQPNGMLWVTDSHLDITPYEWVSTGTTPPVDVEPYIFRQYVGGVTFDNCTLESPSYANRGILGYDFTLSNCIVEIAGVNFNIINYYGELSTKIIINNCRFYESQSETFITVGGGNTDVEFLITDCIVYGTPGLFAYCTTNTKFSCRNVDSSKTLGGLNIIIEDIENCYFGGTSKGAMSKKHYSGVKMVKGTREFLATVKLTCTATASLVASYVQGGNIAGSETLVTVNSAGTYYFTFDKFNGCEVFNLGTTNGTLDEITLFTDDDGQGFSAPSIPAHAYYPDGSIVADSTGATAGWVVSNGHITAL